MKIPRGPGRFNAIAAAGNNIYTSGNQNGVYWSPDNGETWNEPVFQLRYVKTLETWNTVIFAGTDGGGVFFSLDTAKTWKPLNDGLFNFSISSLKVQNITLYAGTHGNGIFKMNLEKLTEVNIFQSKKSAMSTNKIKMLYSDQLFSISSGIKINSVQICDLLGKNLIIKGIMEQNTNKNVLRFSFKGINSNKVLLRINTEDVRVASPVIIFK